MENRENLRLEAFRMHANLYFIGCEKVSVHLIDTGEGLVLLDSGYPSMYELIVENIRKLGFSPADLCAIFHTHGHIDHFGTTGRLVALSGAKTYISRIDNEIVNGTRDLSWAAELGLPRLPAFSADVLLEDGDCFTFGNTSIRCVHTPGHTEGVMSFFLTLADGTVAAMHGGIGMNSMTSSFLQKYGLSFACRDAFREGLAKLAGEKVDLVLGNHPEQSDTLPKMQKVQRGECILDAHEWQTFLRAVERNLEDLIQKDPEPA